MNSWDGAAGYTYFYQGKVNIEVYKGSCIAGGTTWGEFAEALGNVTSDMYLEITLNGEFPGATDSTATFNKSRTWSEDTSCPATSFSETSVSAKLYGPLTFAGGDSNLAFVMQSAITAAPAAADVQVIVNVYKEAGEPTATETETSATETETSATETETSATETETSATETETSATETETSATETETSATETETSATETETQPTETETQPSYEPTEPTTPFIPITESESKPTETQASETETSVSETETQPTESETQPTETEAQPTETAFVEGNAIASWSDVNGLSGVYFDEPKSKAFGYLYSGLAGTNGTWSEFAATIATLTADQYVEVVYTGNFPGAAANAAGISSRVWNETGSKVFALSASDTELKFRLVGPMTSKMADPNIDLTLEGVTGISAATDTHVTVTLYDRTAEPTQSQTQPTKPTTPIIPITESSASETESQPTETESQPSETESQPSETESQPTESEPQPTETGVQPSESESQPTATESQPTATQTQPTEPTTPAIRGDANGDDAVNMKDVLAMRKYLAGMTVSLDTSAADVNNDGAVNMKDVLLVRKFLAGLVSELG